MNSKEDITEKIEGKRNKLDTFESIVVIYLLPFFYGGITRLPFIFFVIHMKTQFLLDWVEIGLFVASYQAMRVVASIVTIPYPILAHGLGTAIGLAGSITVLTSDKTEKLPFLLGTIFIGLSESFAASQTYLKQSDMYMTNLELMRKKLKVQYVAVMIGVTFAFGIGGFVYEYHGINGVSIFGIVLSSLELLSLACYLLIRKLKSSLTKSDTQTNETPKTSEEKAPAKIRATIKLDNEKDTKEALNYFSQSDIKANHINYILCVTFGMESITIGYNLSISPLFIFEEFQKSTSIIGLLFACGAATGTLISMLVSITPQGQAFMKSKFPSPYNLIFSLAGIAISVFVTAIPLFPIHVMGLILLMTFNDLAAIVLTEIQGSVTASNAYALVGPLGQVIRRSFNVVTAITGPLLFGAFSRLPYIVAGSCTSVWVIVLTVVIMKRMKNQKKVLKREGFSNEVMNAYDQMSFVGREILAREKSRGMFLKNDLAQLEEGEEDEDDAEVEEGAEDMNGNF